MTKKSEVFTFDPGSFNRAERQELQQRFGVNFEGLRRYMMLSITERIVSAEALVDAAGKPLFGDEVLTAMVTIARRRTDPDAAESDYDDYSIDKLAATIGEPDPKA